VTRWDAAQAASLSERLAGLVEPDLRRLPTPRRAGERLHERWRTLVANDRVEDWTRRISQLDCAADELPTLLGPVKAKHGGELAWERAVTTLLRDVAASINAVVAPTPEASTSTIPFAQLLAPLARAGAARARQRLGDRTQLLSERAWAQLERQLLQRLAQISEPTLIVEFALFRAQQRSSIERLIALASKPDSDELYCAFVGPDRIAAIAARYPALPRAWAQFVDDWVELTCELVERLHQDRRELSAFLTIDGPLPEVDWIRTDMSDRHHGGRTVALLIFAGGHEVIYKPRNIDIEVRWAELLQWLNDRGAPERLVGLRVLPRTQHGWVEFAKARGCESDADFPVFYRSAGALLCLVWLLAGNDCHRENLIAVGDRPVLVDMETLMHPGPAIDRSDDDDAHAVLARELHHSVLSTAMLPHWSPMPAGGGYEGGGLGPGGAVETSIKGWLRQAANTDESMLVPKSVTLPPAANVPHVAGRYAEADEHREDIVAGFLAMARFVVGIRPALLADDGPIAVFAGTTIRVLLRGTRVYDSALAQSLRPEAMRSGAARSIALDALASPLLRSVATNPQDQDQRPAWAMLEQEQRALERIDVPRFTVAVERSASAWNTHWSESGLSLCRRRIAQLSEPELARQVQLIRASFEARGIVDAKAPRPAAPPPSAPQHIATDAEIRRTVEHIVDRIEALATFGADDTATWLTIDVHEASRAYKLRPMGPTLYSGTGGVGLFLAAAGSILDHDRARRIAQAAVRVIRRDIADGARLNLAIGGAMGAASTAYALAWMGALLDDEDMIADAITALVRIDDAAIERDGHFDLAGGAAGAILAMLAVHSLRPDDTLVARATRCGDHLLAHRTGEPATWQTTSGRRLAGLAHGASGIALALHRLTRVGGEPRFAAAADEALDYEHTLFDAEAGNWHDVRPDVPVGTAYMNSWCNGACGIGMARLDQPASARRIHELDVAVKTTMAQGLGAIDHLCCGNAGRAELLLQAGLRRDDADARQQSRWLFTRMMGRARERERWALARHVHEASEHAGLFRGIAGIGWHGLRQLAPNRLPALGTLDGR
jgi:type 2 lantibiotic biosynthesis protein LanM